MLSVTSAPGLDRLERVGRAATAAGPAVRAVGRRLVGAARGGAFWAAVVLPTAYPGLLLGGRLAVADVPALAALVAANVGVLVLGHGYGVADEGAADLD